MPSSSNLIFPAVHALIAHRGRFLLIKQVVKTDNGEQTFWDIPGGKVQYGESPYDALRREVKEEVGLDIEVREPLGMWWFFRVKDGHQIISTVFRCVADQGNINLSGNPTKELISDFRWVTPEEYGSEGFKHSHDSLHALISNFR